MQVCLFNSTDAQIFVKEIGMTVGAKKQSRVLTEFERVAIINEYSGLRFINVMLENKAAIKSVETFDEDKTEIAMEDESAKPKRKSMR